MTIDEQPVVLRGEKSTNEDGSITLSFTVPADVATEFESQLSANDDNDENDTLERSNYCCTCSNGNSTTIRASNWFSAASKCLGRCGTFGLRRGAC